MSEQHSNQEKVIVALRGGRERLRRFDIFTCLALKDIEDAIAILRLAGGPVEVPPPDVWAKPEKPSSNQAHFALDIHRAIQAEFAAYAITGKPAVIEQAKRLLEGLLRLQDDIHRHTTPFRDGPGDLHRQIDGPADAEILTESRNRLQEPYRAFLRAITAVWPKDERPPRLVSVTAKVRWINAGPQTHRLIEEQVVAAPARSDPNHSTTNDPQGEWSEPMSKTEMARRLLSKSSPRARDIDPLLKQFHLDQVSAKKWKVRLDTLDRNTRQKLESAQ